MQKGEYIPLRAPPTVRSFLVTYIDDLAGGGSDIWNSGADMYILRNVWPAIPSRFALSSFLPANTIRLPADFRLLRNIYQETINFLHGGYDSITPAERRYGTEFEFTLAWTMAARWPELAQHVVDYSPHYRSDALIFQKGSPTFENTLLPELFEVYRTEEYNPGIRTRATEHVNTRDVTPIEDAIEVLQQTNPDDWWELVLAEPYDLANSFLMRAVQMVGRS